MGCAVSQPRLGPSSSQTQLEASQNGVPDPSRQYGQVIASVWEAPPHWSSGTQAPPTTGNLCSLTTNRMLEEAACSRPLPKVLPPLARNPCWAVGAHSTHQPMSNKHHTSQRKPKTIEKSKGHTMESALATGSADVSFRTSRGQKGRGCYKNSNCACMKGKIP